MQAIPTHFSMKRLPILQKQAKTPSIYCAIIFNILFQKNLDLKKNQNILELLKIPILFSLLKRER